MVLLNKLNNTVLSKKKKNELEKIIDVSDSENEMKVLASTELKELKKRHEINEKKTEIISTAER